MRINSEPLSLTSTVDGDGNISSFEFRALPDRDDVELKVFWSAVRSPKNIGGKAEVSVKELTKLWRKLQSHIRKAQPAAKFTYPLQTGKWFRIQASSEDVDRHTFHFKEFSCELEITLHALPDIRYLSTALETLLVSLTGQAPNPNPR